MPPVGFEPTISAGERPAAAYLLRSWVTYLPDFTASDRCASLHVSLMHRNGVKERTCWIIEGKGRRELSCSLLHFKMLPSQAQYWHIRKFPLCQDCIYTYFMNYCSKYWRKMSFILFFLSSFVFCPPKVGKVPVLVFMAKDKFRQ